MKKTRHNIVGPKVRMLRKARGWKQSKLAKQCTSLGWKLEENTVTKIEKQVRCINDAELTILALALKAKLKDFFPEHPDLS